MTSFGGKVVVVTGASKGIGRAIAQYLGESGASVVVNYNKDEAGANSTVKNIKECGGYAVAVQGDVSKYSEAKMLVDKTIEIFGKVDILINNAGISYVGLFMDMTEEELQKITDINLKGIMFTTHAALPHFIKVKKGHIVNISSVWGNVGASCEVAYSATKGGVNSFTKALAKELAPSNIRVNAVSPGVINTSMNKWLTDEEKLSLEEDIPMGRFGEVNEIAKTIAFLCSDESSYITGQIITVDGGML
ncbi:3-ketoacyl-ACP reductase [Clostridium polyendosporum]|uniref:3-ketoacyl-ACP reductase n=1 Tax=Clostridium polyendosporum TaxID=69208 RepID=A0A919RY40_9CLOT|nr:SDR family oxidoreductase [Clostridium polyendosporum]GIM28655.1 3-ketoacyl-ACP reductase [Clostridium polyendosporum]